MSRADKINSRINLASKEREGIDGETFTIGGVDYTGIFHSVEEDFRPEETGHDQRDRLSGIARIDQFLADPATFDPAKDYTQELPSRSSKVALRGKIYRIKDTQTAHSDWLFELEEMRPRP